MRILITGGLGYIGGRLSQYFQEQGVQEIIVGSRKRRDEINNTLIYKFVETNWGSKIELQKICKGVDTIIHLAGMNRQESNIDPQAAFSFNTLATANLLNSAINQGVKRFIYFSTAHVYGNPLKGIICEKTLPTSFDPYATSNRAAEDFIRSAIHRKEIDGCVIRLSNSFGAPVNKDTNCWSLVINDLCRQVVTTHTMTLKTSGVQRRDFITLTDVCRATDHLVNLESINNCVFNIGGNWSPRILDLAHIIQKRSLKILGFKPEIYIEASRPEKTYNLEYRTDLLYQTGFVNLSDINFEIDKLLVFCKINFT